MRTVTDCHSKVTGKLGLGGGGSEMAKWVNVLAAIGSWETQQVYIEQKPADRLGEQPQASHLEGESCG